VKRVPWWVWVSALPVGLGAWAPIVPGLALRRRAWIAWGVLWTAVTLAGFIGTAPANPPDWAGLLLIVGWVGAVATTLIIRPTYQHEIASPFRREREAAEQRLHDRAEAQKLARENPALAKEVGVGRAGLVDVNNAPAAELATLPGVDAALAARIVSLRERIDGFESVEDLGNVLDLDGDAVERLRDHVVCLPR
jgi:DNA uptake protein ComE-like DNA-binding protein